MINMPPFLHFGKLLFEIENNAVLFLIIDLFQWIHDCSVPSRIVIV